MSGSEHTFDRVPKRPGTIPEDGAPGYDAGYDVGYQDAGCEDGSEYDEPYGGSAYAGSEEGEFEFVRADDGLNDGPDADPIGDQDDDLEAPDDPEDGSEPDSDEDQDGWADPETGYAGTGPGSGHADRGWNEIPDDGIFYADLPGTDGARDAADELDMNSIGLNTCPPEAGHGLNGFNGSSERQNRQGLQGGMAAGFGPDAMGANGMDHAGMGADPRDPGRLADVFSDAAGQADAAGRMDLASAAEPRPRGRSLLPLCAAVLTAATAGAAVWFGAQGEGPLAEPVRHARAVIEAAAGVTGVPLPFASETHEAGRTEAGRTGTGSPEAARPGARGSQSETGSAAGSAAGSVNAPRAVPRASSRDTSGNSPEPASEAGSRASEPISERVTGTAAASQASAAGTAEPVAAAESSVSALAALFAADKAMDRAQDDAPSAKAPDAQKAASQSLVDLKSAGQVPAALKPADRPADKSAGRTPSGAGLSGRDGAMKTASAAENASAPASGTAIEPVSLSAGRPVRPYHGEDAVTLAPITDFAPGTVYSGTLGEVTRLRAGTEAAKAALTLRETQVRVQELEQRLQQGARDAETAAGRRARAAGGAEPADRAAQDALLARLQALLDGRGGSSGETSSPADPGWRVVAVRGHGKALEAVVRGHMGLHIVREGSVLPGAGTVERVTQSGVRVAGRELPWR